MDNADAAIIKRLNLTDIKAEDRGELVSLMEPLLITDSSRYRGPLTDLTLELTLSIQPPLFGWRNARTILRQNIRRLPPV